MNIFPVTKSELINNLINFSQNELNSYSSNRNFDYGTPHSNVSKLSPYLRRRFISEEDVLKIILKDHKINKVEKFVEEIFWRTYWKGWLESHPWIYEQFKVYKKEQKTPSKTGIKCFDYWKEELLDTGYLHNHSRMWFASIWIFTLGYSWQSGANFFKNNLLDYCPASNTLGWRWVAGLQTIGKPYIASPENIKFFTKERFYPKNQLSENFIFSNKNFSNGKAIDIELPKNCHLKNQDKIGVIINNNDLSLNEILKAKGIFYNCCLFFNENENTLINNFQKNIYEDICNMQSDIRLADNFQDIYKWLQDKKIENLIIPYETVGNKIFNKTKFLKKISDLGVNFTFYSRKWDFNAFPYATKGFYNFKKKIPEFINMANS